MTAILTCYDLVIVPGFYGIGTNNQIRTFPRGGSDYTAAILAASLGKEIVEVHENFTDVNGVLAADPKIIPNARKIEVMSLRELSELTLGGSFGVFQAEAVAPLARAGIPISLRNTFRLGENGTKILTELSTTQDLVRGIAYRGDYTIVNIRDYDMGIKLGLWQES